MTNSDLNSIGLVIGARIDVYFLNGQILKRHELIGISDNLIYYVYDKFKFCENGNYSSGNSEVPGYLVLKHEFRRLPFQVTLVEVVKIDSAYNYWVRIDTPSYGDEIYIDDIESYHKNLNKYKQQGYIPFRFIVDGKQPPHSIWTRQDGLPF